MQVDEETFHSKHFYFWGDHTQWDSGVSPDSSHYSCWCSGSHLGCWELNLTSTLAAVLSFLLFPYSKHLTLYEQLREVPGLFHPIAFSPFLVYFDSLTVLPLTLPNSMFPVISWMLIPSHQVETIGGWNYHRYIETSVNICKLWCWWRDICLCLVSQKFLMGGGRAVAL